MAFCRYCGASLAEGQTCTCPQSVAAAQSAATQTAPQGAPAQQGAYQPQQPVYYQQPAQPQQPSAAQQQAAAAAQAAQTAAVDTAKSLGGYLKEYFTDASGAVRRVAEQDNLSFALILTVIRALSMGLAVYGLLRKACSIALQTAIATAGAFSYGSSMSEVLSTSIKAPLMGSLLYGALMGLVGMALYIVMVYILMKLQKGAASLRMVYEASAANGVLPTALLLLSFLASFVSLPLAVFCLILAGLSWVVCGVLTAQLLCADNVSGKFWVLYFVGVVLVFWVSGYILPNLFLSAVGGISVSSLGSPPITLKQSIDAMKMQLAQMGGWSGLFQELIDEFF